MELYLIMHFIPANSPCVAANVVKPTKPYTAMRNKKGARGSPCLKPLSCLKSSIGLLLTKIDKLLEMIHILI